MYLFFCFWIIPVSIGFGQACYVDIKFVYRIEYFFEGVACVREFESIYVLK